MPEIEWQVYRPPGGAHTCLVPSTAFDLKAVERQRWKHGDVVTANFTRHRSGKHHRLVFALLRFVFEAQERFSHPEGLRAFLTLQTTFVVECSDSYTGEILRYPKSWSYADLDETEFSELHDQLYPVIMATFFPEEGVDWLKASVNEQAFQDGLLNFFD